MKKIISIIFAVCFSVSLISCNAKEENTSSELNDWQKNVLETEGLPTEADQLTQLRKNTINRIYDMVTYLKEKYEEEFVYVEYIPKELNESEKLIVYPQSIGSGDGRNLVTVKSGANGEFTDNYFDYSVADYSEKLINDFWASNFDKDDYLYYSRPNACYIKKSEIIDGKFRWDYGASNIFFLKEEACDMEHIEEFSVNYAKFLYEHQIDGTHRINMMSSFPSISISKGNLDDWYDTKESLGYYCLSIDAIAKEVRVSSLIINGEIRFQQTYTIEEYFSKSK